MAAINKLTAKSVAALKEPGRFSDGGNLYLNVAKGGSKSWIFFYRLNGKQREMGLGPAGEDGVTLAKVRELAAEARKLLALGIDPLDARRKAEAEAKAEEERQITFGQFADDFVRLHRDGWKNPKHRQQWENTLSDTYIPDLRKRPISAVTTEDVVKVLKPIWTTTPETANRLRLRIEKVLDAARVEAKRVGENPARWRGHLALLLPKRGPRGRSHHASMAWQDLPAFMAKLEEREGVAARAVQFAILTAARSGEVRNAVWSEFDLDRGVWEIPAEKMKAGRPHRVPLAEAAVAVVQTMLPLRPRRDFQDAYVFPGLRRAPLSDMTLSAVLKRMGASGVTIHGFRSSFRVWCSEATSFSHEVCELALAHAVGDQTVTAYQRSDLFERRIELMRHWASYVMTPPEDAAEVVVPIRSATA
ncbi:tyrosine-type recombinase/integrase [Tabrizicola aquatica]|uniref:tyrosine-type recombinase/integrase n=1 Tax=Tabrizicola aquatica TaxID=909926 RepID=UPI000CD135B1|nr:site-specific integrase [Tabrizicola aquatica]